jgi:4-amino-4-deoxy-L-arabinose transferase-like glycosyltransferase
MVFVWYALSFVLFGDNVWAPRLLAALLLSGATYVMYLEGRLLWSHRMGLVAAAALGLSFGLATLETGANTEFFLIPPLVGSLYAFSKGQRTGSAWWYGAAGFLAAVAVATKHISFFVFLLYAILAVWPLLRAQGLKAFTSPDFRVSVGGLAAGGTAATVAVLVPFALTGTLPDLWEATVVYTLKYVGDVPMSSKLEIFRRSPLYLTFVLGPWAMLCIFAVFQLFKSGGGGHGPLVVGFMAANWLGVIAAGRFYDHYYVTLLPAAALMAPLGAKYVRDRLSSRAFRYSFAIVFVLLAVPVVTQNAEIYLQPTAADRHIAKYPLDDRAPWENQGPEFGAWIAERTEPGDPVYNFGFQSELYFYADRYSPTRFLLDRPFWTNDEYVEQALAELNADPPVYVIDSAVNEQWSQQKLYTPEIKAWIVENYDYVGEVYYAEVWKRKDAE